MYGPVVHRLGTVRNPGRTMPRPGGATPMAGVLRMLLLNGGRLYLSTAW